MAIKPHWLTDPGGSHRAWRAGLVVAERPYAQQSQRLYISLFGRFCKWMTANGLDLARVQSADLARFLDSLTGRGGMSASNRSQRTYIAEIDRVFSHLCSTGQRTSNPATDLLSTLRITTPLRPRNIHLLKPGSRQSYLDWLEQQTAQTEGDPKLAQEAAMALLMLDAGLTLKEVQKLNLRHLDGLSQDRLRAPGHRLLQPRELEITPESAKALRRWLALRDRLVLLTPKEYRQHMAQAQLPRRQQGNDIAGTETSSDAFRRDSVFVAYPSKGASERHVVVTRATESSIYLAAQRVVQCGMQADDETIRLLSHKGPQVLRNYCCARLMLAGLPSAEIASFLGLLRVDQVWAMARQVQPPGSAAARRALRANRKEHVPHEEELAESEDTDLPRPPAM